MSRAELENAMRLKVPINELELSDMNLSGMDFSEQVFNKVSLTGANIERCRFNAAVFIDCAMDGLDFSSKMLEKTRFICSSLKGCRCGLTRTTVCPSNTASQGSLMLTP